MHDARFGRPTVAVTRQPILDASEQVMSYELQTPQGDDELGGTAGVLAVAIADIGLRRLAGARPVHVDVSRDFLLTIRPLPLDPRRVVLEVPAAEAPDDLLLALAGEVREAGFRIVLDGFRLDAHPLLAVADGVKLDVGHLDRAELETAVETARALRLEVIADGVHTRADHRACRDLPFDAFQGRYFAEPETVAGRAAPTYRLRALALLADGAPVPFEQLERVIEEDPGLSLKLVKLANSAYFAGRHRAASIRQALMTLGSVAVRRWAALLVLAGVKDRPSHLLELGLLRARLCELVAASTPDVEADRAFTVGLFSIVDSLLGMRMPALVADLPFDDRTSQALAAHEGPEGRLLAGVLAYERGDFAACAESGVGLVDIALAYRDALDWTDETLTQLAA